MRQLEELIQHAQFVHDLHGGGMYRVAAEITQEVRVLFENDNVDTRACEQEPQHETGRTSARDAAPGLDDRCQASFSMLFAESPSKSRIVRSS